MSKGVDKQGRPIYIEKVGAVDFKKLFVLPLHLASYGLVNLALMNRFAIATEDDILRSLVASYEKLEAIRLPACSRKEGRLVETFNGALIISASTNDFLTSYVICSHL